MNFSDKLATLQRPRRWLSYAELVELADGGETLECGCDAHQLLHDMLGIDVAPVSQ